LRRPGVGAFEHHGRHFDVAGRYGVPRSPQGQPVIFQAGDSDDGRDFAAATADCIFSRHGTLNDGRAFYDDIHRRMARAGRPDDDLLILPAAMFVLGDTDADAQERAAAIRRQQVSGPTAILFLEQVWKRDLSDLDPDGPLPAFDPDPQAAGTVQGRTTMFSDPVATARTWRERAEAGHLSIRDLIIEVTSRAMFVGSPATVAADLDRHVQAGAADGFILVPHITPGGLDRFADTVIPLLQERGVYRTAYEGTTLRDHLGLRPARPAAESVRYLERIAAR
jgi:alkanesulfonate monooxygenase SsuD/methylene tetrahydromethanopterin reductase-like flavin-dependent oxidoreductase (luciferase family)